MSSGNLFWLSIASNIIHLNHNNGFLITPKICWHLQADKSPTAVGGSVNNINKTGPCGDKCGLLLSHHLWSSSISDTFTARLPLCAPLGGPRNIMARDGRKDTESLYERLSKLAGALLVTFTNCVGLFLNHKQWFYGDSCTTKNKFK